MSRRHRGTGSRVLAALATLSFLVSACSATSEQSADQSAVEAQVAPVPAAGTAGCSTPGSPESATATSSATSIYGSSETKTLKVDGTSRKFVLYLPRNYDGSTPLPLVLNFHGLGSSAQQQMLVSGLGSLADEKNFIAVAPNAVGDSWDLPDDATNPQSAETAYLKSLTNYLDKNYCVDTERTYSMGFSQGSAMTFLLACLPNSRIAAFGGVGATFYRPACGQSAPAPIIYFHGTKDTVVPINGGNTPTIPVGPALESMNDWAKHNHCASDPTESTREDITTFSWSSCRNSADVIYHRIANGGHTWPGADAMIAGFMESRLGKTTQSIAATRAMWEFFEYRTLSQRVDQ